MKILLLMLLGGCASQDPWTTSDTVWEGVYVATAIADGYMTTKIQDHPNIVEDGPIARHALGLNPSTRDTWLYVGTLIVSHYFVSRMLPEGWRTIWQIGTSARHALAVNHGNQLGLFGEPCTRHQEEHPCE